MPDDRRDCPSPLIPGVIGGLIGAALVDDAYRENAAQFRREMDELAAIERARLAEEQKRLALAQTEAQRNETDRAYRQAVLWLEHCDNNERLDWLVRGHGAALADELAARAIADARERSEIVALFDEVRAARHALEDSQANKAGRESQRDELRRRRWKGSSLSFGCAAVGFAILIPFWVYLGAKAVGGYVLFVAACAVISPLIVRWQPTPEELAPQILGDSFGGSLRDSIASVESAIATAEAEISTATIEHALARETLSQTFRAMQPVLLAEASRYNAPLRTRIEALQSIYPPRIRCDLAAISDAALHARLAPHIPAALDRALAKII